MYKNIIVWGLQLLCNNFVSVKTIVWHWTLWHLKWIWIVMYGLTEDGYVWMGWKPININHYKEKFTVRPPQARLTSSFQCGPLSGGWHANKFVSIQSGEDWGEEELMVWARFQVQHGLRTQCLLMEQQRNKLDHQWRTLGDFNNRTQMLIWSEKNTVIKNKAQDKEFYLC